MVKEIKLTKGHYALVDDEDFEFLNQWKWYSNHKYATRNLGKARVFMHRLLLNAPKDKFVDHVNGNPLDNRKCNIRLCTYSENGRNQKLAKHNTTGFKGVSFQEKYKSYRVSLNINQKITYLGSYKSAEEAAIIYDIWAIYYFGEFAKTNKMLGLRN
jgi:hypothetical protein